MIGAATIPARDVRVAGGSPSGPAASYTFKTPSFLITTSSEPSRGALCLLLPGFPGSSCYFPQRGPDQNKAVMHWLEHLSYVLHVIYGHAKRRFDQNVESIGVYFCHAGQRLPTQFPRAELHFHGQTLATQIGQHLRVSTTRTISSPCPSFSSLR